MKQYKIGVVGFAHMHITHLVDTLFELADRVVFTGLYDPAPAVATLTDQGGNRHRNVAKIAEQTGAPVLDSIEAVLGTQPDLVVVCSENARHAEICSQILLRGIHVLVEKPMAPTMQQAYAMARAAQLGGARLFINWPSTWMPVVRTAERLVREGRIGKPFRFHYRNYSSLGPFSYGQTLTDREKSVEWWHQDFTGGGATMDYCCYGACLARWMLDSEPIAAYGVRANFAHQFSSGDDYGTITAQFPEAVAIVEGSWTTVHPGVPNGPIISGLEGTLVADTDADEVRLFNQYHGKDAPEAVAADPLPEGRETIGKEVIHCLDTGDAPHPTLDLPVNLGAMMLLDAGIRSAKSGMREQTGSAVYTIGE